MRNNNNNPLSRVTSTVTVNEDYIEGRPIKHNDTEDIPIEEEVAYDNPNGSFQEKEPNFESFTDSKEDSVYSSMLGGELPGGFPEFDRLNSIDKIRIINIVKLIILAIQK